MGNQGNPLIPAVIKNFLVIICHVEFRAVAVSSHLCNVLVLLLISLWHSWHKAPSSSWFWVMLVQPGAGQDVAWHRPGVAAATKVQALMAAHWKCKDNEQNPSGCKIFTKRKRNLGDGEANALVWLVCTPLSVPSAPWGWRMLLMCPAQTCDTRGEKWGYPATLLY